jgi:ATP-dependent DNA ligase
MHSTQLCQLASDFRGDLPSGGALTEQKIDGWRALRFRGIEGKPMLWSRNGMPLEGLGHIAYHLQRMEDAAGEPMYFDGEVQVDGTLAATKHWLETGWRMGGEAGHLYLFDCMTQAEWQAGGTSTPLIQRKARLRELAEAAAGDQWEWRPGSHGRGHGSIPVSVLDQARRVWAAEGEGIVLKDALSPYRRNRNGHWLKVKHENQHKWINRVGAFA